MARRVGSPPRARVFLRDGRSFDTPVAAENWREWRRTGTGLRGVAGVGYFEPGDVRMVRALGGR